MPVRFQADADLDGRIIRGLRRTAPEIDIRTAADDALAALADAEVLRIAAESGRILVSQDRRTMPSHFSRFVADAQSAGVILLREAIPISIAIEELELNLGRQRGRRMDQSLGLDSTLKRAFS